MICCCCEISRSLFLSSLSCRKSSLAANDSYLMPFLTGSHSFRFLLTYIEGTTPFPSFSVLYMLDDITVGYYNSETNIYTAKGNTTNEDEEVDLINSNLKDYSPPILKKFKENFKNKTDGEFSRKTLRQKL